MAISLHLSINLIYFHYPKKSRQHIYNIKIIKQQFNCTIAYTPLL